MWLICYLDSEEFVASYTLKTQYNLTKSRIYCRVLDRIFEEFKKRVSTFFRLSEAIALLDMLTR